MLPTVPAEYSITLINEPFLGVIVPDATEACMFKLVAPLTVIVPFTCPECVAAELDAAPKLLVPVIGAVDVNVPVLSMNAACNLNGSKAVPESVNCMVTIPVLEFSNTRCIFIS